MRKEQTGISRAAFFCIRGEVSIRTESYALGFDEPLLIQA